MCDVIRVTDAGGATRTAPRLNMRCARRSWTRTRPHAVGVVSDGTDELESVVAGEDTRRHTCHTALDTRKTQALPGGDMRSKAHANKQECVLPITAMMAPWYRHGMNKKARRRMWSTLRQ